MEQEIVYWMKEIINIMIYHIIKNNKINLTLMEINIFHKWIVVNLKYFLKK